MSYLDVFEVTHVLHAVRPFHGDGRQEILKQPKLYAFDTGLSVTTVAGKTCAIKTADSYGNI